MAEKKDKIQKDNEDSSKELNRVLGLGEEITGFIDGVGRVAYPVTLDKLGEFLENVQYVSPDNILSSILGGAEDKLRNMFSMVFKAEDVESAIQNVYAKNYSSIVSQILNMNGFDLSTDKEKKEDSSSEPKKK